MAVYVDKLFITETNKKWRFKSACHMMADDLEELHIFAAKIGMKKEWFQGPPEHMVPHYDLTAAKRKKAVQLGAIEADYKKVKELIRFWRS